MYYVGRLRDKQLWKDKTPIADEGMTLTGAIDALTMKGACLDRSWPFVLNRLNEAPPPHTYGSIIHHTPSTL